LLGFYDFILKYLFHDRITDKRKLFKKGI
jgi:hypothetical protein